MANAALRIEAARVVLLAAMALGHSCSSPAQLSQQCEAETAVYSVLGARLPFTVTSVTLAAHPEVELMNRRVDGMLTNSQGSRIRFSERHLVGGPEVDVVLSGPGNGRVKLRTMLPACGSRLSVFDEKGIVSQELSEMHVKGRLSGCDLFRGDWWIMMTPMFGRVHPLRPEAVIEATGHFRLLLQPFPARHHVLVGKGKDLVKAFAVDVASTREMDLGEVQLGKCP